MKVDSDFLLSGQRFPPGFRFHPTDEELLLYYLKRKICCKRRRLDVITETDVYKWDPEELPEMSKLKTGDRQWFFFSPRDRKYPNKARSNRATGRGYWKATGKDRVISYGSRTVGIKKTLVFYRGRAPNGERTDWVMHEYTLNEEELKRCQDFKAYYALYKVYKKSGPGPKNGEQYGAPFREEEWDEEDLEVQFPIEQEKPAKQANEIVPFDDSRTVRCQDPQPSLDELDEILNRIAAEDSSIQPADVDCGYDLDQFVGEEETLSAAVHRSSVDVILPMVQAFSQQPYVPVNFDIAEATPLQSREAPELSSAPFVNMQDPDEEDFLKDYLEMDDLESDLNISHDNWGNNLGSLQFDEFDGLNNPYQDASSFLCEPVEPWLVSQLNNRVMDPNSNTTPNYAMLEQCSNANASSYRVWRSEPTFSVVIASEANQGFDAPSTSGDPCRNLNNGSVAGGNENGKGGEDEGTDSWFSSTIWSFLESIPTNPASAAEGILVNKDCERRSSLSRVRINSRNVRVAATSRNSGKSRIGLLCFSILGVMFAILWMLTGTSMRMIGLCS